MGTWSSFDAYLFDLDGTLVDTAPDIDAALNFALAEQGLDGVDEQLTRHWVGHGSKVLIEQALAHRKQADVDAAQLLETFLGYYAEHLAVHSQPYPGVINTLTQLRRRGAKLAIVTNKLTQLSAPLVEQIGLADYIELLVCGDTAAAPKPDPAPLHYCLDQFGGLPASRALFVGDSDTDVNAANAAMMPVVCVRDGYNHGVDVTTLKVDGVIDHFDELL